MSTIAFKAALVREIEQAMSRTDIDLVTDDEYDYGLKDGKLDAYAHVLLLLKDEDL